MLENLKKKETDMMETDLSFSGNSYIWNVLRSHGQNTCERGSSSIWQRGINKNLLRANTS